MKFDVDELIRSGYFCFKEDFSDYISITEFIDEYMSLTTVNLKIGRKKKSIFSFQWLYGLIWSNDLFCETTHTAAVDQNKCSILIKSEIF